VTGPAPSDDRPAPGGSAATGGPPQASPHHVVTRTRAGTVWFGAASFAVILVLLLIFILQNSRKVQISYLGAHGHLPLGVALLLAAVLGILLVVIPGTARIIQLRTTVRRHRTIAARRADSVREPPEAGVSPPGNRP